MNDIGLRVLVVDDERAIRRYLHAALNAQGYTVYEASGGKEALNMVVADRPDLIILTWACLIWMASRLPVSCVSGPTSQSSSFST